MRSTFRSGREKHFFYENKQWAYTYSYLYFFNETDKQTYNPS